MNTSRAVIISDVHMGPGGPLTVFRDGASLALFFDQLAADGQPTELVLGGDVIDFLQCEGYSGFDCEKAPSRFESIVRHNSSVFEALSRFAAGPGHEVTLLSGNHDPEVLLPVVRDAFEQAIGCPSNVRYEERLVSGDNERWSVWGRTLMDGQVWVVHGDRWDIHNAIDRDALLHDQHLTLPPGSRLVYEVLSQLQVKQPWVYELKPELETVLPLLFYLDPKRALGYLHAHYGLTWRMLKGMVRARLVAGPLLGTGHESTVVTDVGGLLADALADSLRGVPASDGQVLLAQFETWQPGVASATATLASHQGVSRWLLRAWLQHVRRTQRFLTEDGDDDLPHHATPYLPDTLRAFIAGHTHGPRWSSNRRPAYFNSGTWIPVGSLPEGDIEHVIDNLEAGQAWPVTVPRTFVVVRQGGAHIALGRCDETGVAKSGLL